jgi:hypothetical protein
MATKWGGRDAPKKGRHKIGQIAHEKQFGPTRKRVKVVDGRTGKARMKDE